MQPSLAVILREKIGSQNTHYVHGLRGIASQHDGAGWSDAVSDGLGSVRGWLNGSQNFVSSANYSPYGVPSGAVDNFGFTGEMTDDNGLVYLRARYYDPNIGNFVSLDPFEGVHNRPMSVNGYSWVEGNVANWVDASGLIPTESDVASGRAEFTCNCGWLDWNHIENSDSRTYTLFDDIQHIIKNGQSNQFWAIRFNIQLGFAAGPISLETNLFDDYAVMPSERVTLDKKLEIATNIFMSANEIFEELQIILAGQLTQSAMYPPHYPGEAIIAGYLGVERLYSSFYAEEDLVSDILGFYVGYQRHENLGTTSENIHTKIRELCKAVNINKDTSNSLAIFKETYANGANLVNGWQQWRPRFIPLTGCNTNLCGERRWPTEFQSITNLQTRDDNERGWVWYSRFVDAPPLLSIGETNRPNVYRVG